MLNTYLSIPPASGAAPSGGGGACAGICYFGLKYVQWCRVERVLICVSSLLSTFPQIRKQHFKATFSWFLLPKIGDAARLLPSAKGF